MKVQFSLSGEVIEKFCKDYKCKPNEISIILKTSFSGDKESRFYRDFGSEPFDLNAWLVSQSPTMLMTKRSEALTKIKKITIDTEPTQTTL